MKGRKMFAQELEVSVVVISSAENVTNNSFISP